MNDDAGPWRRFGPEFVAAHRRKYGSRQPQERALTYDIAVNEEYEAWREWLDDQFSALPASAADRLEREIWLDKHFWSKHFELAIGAKLRSTGLRVEYEMRWNGLSPDWTVLAKDGRPLCFAEVVAINPPADTFAHMRAWHDLVERIKRIPVGVVLTLAASREPISPLDAGLAKKITEDLLCQLMEPWTRAYFTSNGYTFLVMGDPQRGGAQMVSPLGLKACFVPPSSRAGSVSARRMVQLVTEKVARYRALAQAYQAPLIVAVGAHKFTGVTIEHVDRLLAGEAAPIMTFQFNFGDAYIPPQEVVWEPIEPWPMPEELAELVWVDHEFPFGLSYRPNPVALQPLPSKFWEPQAGVSL